jgi:integrase
MATKTTETKKMTKRARGTGGLVNRKGSAYLYGLLWEHGKKRMVSLKTTSRVEAERKLRKLMGHSERGELLPTDVARVTYEELREALIADYKLNSQKSLYTAADGSQRITATKHLDTFFAGYRVTRITTDAIDAFKLARRDAGEAAGTTNRALSMLKRMFHIAVRSGKVQAVPYIGMLKEAAPREGFLQPDQFRQLRQALPERLRALATLAYYTGMRAGELKRLRWERVDLDAGTLRLHNDETKSGKPRIVPLNQEVWQMLELLPRSGEYVFGGARPLGSFRKAWASACKRAGLPDTLFHDLRRSGVRNLRRAGVPREVAMKISGHKTESVYRRYSIVDESDLRDAVRKLDNFLESKTDAGNGEGEEFGSTLVANRVN